MAKKSTHPKDHASMVPRQLELRVMSDVGGRKTSPKMKDVGSRDTNGDVGTSTQDEAVYRSIAQMYFT